MSKESNGSLAHRIDHLEGAHAINRLVSDYCHGFDKQRWEIFESVWSDDAVWDADPYIANGRTAIVAMAKGMWTDLHIDASFHHTSNIRVEIAGDSASGLIDVLVGVRFRDGSWQWGFGSYEHRYRRRDARWQIVECKAPPLHVTQPIVKTRRARP